MHEEIAGSAQNGTYTVCCFAFCLFARRRAMLWLTEKYFQSAAFVLSARTYICIVCVCERRTLVRILPRYKYTCTLASSYIHLLSLKNVITLLFCSALLARALSIFYFAPCLFYE